MSKAAQDFVLRLAFVFGVIGGGLAYCVGGLLTVLLAACIVLIVAVVELIIEVRTAVQERKQ